MSVAIAYLLADLSIPEDTYYLGGALFVPSVVLSIGLAAGVLIGCIASPASVLRAESILSLGLVYWVTLDPIQGSYGLWRTSLTAVQNAYLGTAIFACAMWIGSSLSMSRWPIRQASLDWEVPPGLVFRIGIFVFLCGLLKPMLACGFNPLCLGEGFFMPWLEVPWKTYRFPDSGFGLNTLLLYLGFLGFLSLPVAVVMRHLERRTSWRVIVLWCFGLIILLLLVQAGSRRIVGLTAGSAAIVWILLKPKVGFWRLARLGIVSAGLLVLLEIMVSWRNIGIGEALARGQPLSTNAGLIKVDKNFHYMTHAMTVVPDPHPYPGVDMLLWTIGGPIPKSIWPSKPAHRGIDLVEIIGERKQPGFTWSCSAVCDLYLIGGMVPIALGGLVFGLLAGACNHFLFMPPTIRSRMLYGFGVMVLFVGLRSIRDLMSIGLVVMLLLMMVLAVRRLARRRRHRVVAT